MSLLSTLAVVVRAQGVERTNRQLDSVDKTGGRAARSVVALEQRFSKLDNTLATSSACCDGRRSSLAPAWLRRLSVRSPPALLRCRPRLRRWQEAWPRMRLVR
jgi:hypothetical protein